jgi:hypothetical protein
VDLTHRLPILDESLDITEFLGQFHPKLYPSHLQDTINALLRQLHDIRFFALTYARAPQRAQDMEDAVKKRLADPTISETYRKALEYKLAM